jgi:transcription elongation factor/antiterminator RfaH
MDGSFGFSNGRRWYAVKAQPRREILAELHLNRQAFEVFLPTSPQVVRRGRKLVTLAAPFFPGYLFVRLDVERDRWRAVNGTVGVINLVQFGDRPTPVPAGLVEDLIALAGPDGDVQFDEAFEPGESVRLIGGAFDRMEAVFQRADGPERVRVLMTLLAQEVSVTVPRSVVMAVG